MVGLPAQRGVRQPRGLNSRGRGRRGRVDDLTLRGALFAVVAVPAVVRCRTVGERHGKRVVFGEYVRLGRVGRCVKASLPVIGHRRTAGAEQLERIDQAGGGGAGVGGAPREPVRDIRTGHCGQRHKGIGERPDVPERFVFQVCVLVLDLGHLLGDFRDLRHAMRDLDALIRDDGHALRERREVGDAEQRVRGRGPQEGREQYERPKDRVLHRVSPSLRGRGLKTHARAASKARSAFAFRACQRLRRPPLCCGPPGDTPGPLRHGGRDGPAGSRRPGPAQIERGTSTSDVSQIRSRWPARIVMVGSRLRKRSRMLVAPWASPCPAPAWNP